MKSERIRKAVLGNVVSAVVCLHMKFTSCFAYCPYLEGKMG
jgi:hypothetical protein